MPCARNSRANAIRVEASSSTMATSPDRFMREPGDACGPTLVATSIDVDRYYKHGPAPDRGLNEARAVRAGLDVPARTPTPLAPMGSYLQVAYFRGRSRCGP